MYDEIFCQITNAANKRNLRDSTIHAYCTSIAHFLKYTDKPIDALTTDDVDTFLTKKRLSGISPETYNHYHSGIRFFYKKVLKISDRLSSSFESNRKTCLFSRNASLELALMIMERTVSPAPLIHLLYCLTAG